MDFKRDLRIGFGQYVQAKPPNKVRNSMHERTKGCMPSANMYDEDYDIQTEIFLDNADAIFFIMLIRAFVVIRSFGIMQLEVL